MSFVEIGNKISEWIGHEYNKLDEAVGKVRTLLAYWSVVEYVDKEVLPILREGVDAALEKAKIDADLLAQLEVELRRGLEVVALRDQRIQAMLANWPVRETI